MSFTKRFQPVPLGDTNLFKPIKVGDVQLNHRAVLAPLTRLRCASDNLLSEEFAPDYYSQRSQEPGTLIITEGAVPSLQSIASSRTPGLFTDEQLSVWSRVFRKIHENGSFVFVQMWSAGRNADLEVLTKNDLRYDSATDNLYIDNKAEETAAKLLLAQHGITKQEINDYIRDWVRAAKLTMETGADGIEVHGANGYLLNQFLDPISNHRSDEYGGSIENRSRFPLELIDALIDALGASKLGIRLSPYGLYGGMSGGDNPLIVAQHAYIIGELEKRAQRGNRLAYIHLVEPRVTIPSLPEGQGVYGGGTNDFVYSIWRGVVIRCGDIALYPNLAKEFTDNRRTLIAYGRFFISNPDLARRLRDGLPLTEYNRATFYTFDSVGYTDYPNYETCLKLGYV
ncbi:hypothetical protein ZYGR_0AS05280 [Zygosaccharomyces rouxii]|uniref:NADH:flavin oxidoreductase/NADH oxidase N-terminal domain-containing protein n=1 Tax=Zygosaccharomyces rouxii TaxID=4956 RepID=A0A1Q3AHH7_ZYGRO|nr:hypothetical protein ZYGR_0AS05280 [Zygosaccharomyces rouxii]